jgi:hypothetical protein
VAAPVVPSTLAASSASIHPSLPGLSSSLCTSVCRKRASQEDAVSLSEEDAVDSHATPSTGAAANARTKQ